MTQQHLPLAMIVVALVSMTLFALTATAWSARRSDDDSGSAVRPGWRENLVGVVVAIGVVGTILTVARSAGWNRNRAMWVGIGGFLGLMTVLRPVWFWENYRARWLRNLIGDGATAIVYLLVAALMVWIGLNTDWTFGRR